MSVGGAGPGGPVAFCKLLIIKYFIQTRNENALDLCRV